MNDKYQVFYQDIVQCVHRKHDLCAPTSFQIQPLMIKACIHGLLRMIYDFTFVCSTHICSTLDGRILLL